MLLLSLFYADSFISYVFMNTSSSYRLILFVTCKLLCTTSTARTSSPVENYSHDIDSNKCNQGQQGTHKFASSVAKLAQSWPGQSCFSLFASHSMQYRTCRLNMHLFILKFLTRSRPAHSSLPAFHCIGHVKQEDNKSLRLYWVKAVVIKLFWACCIRLVVCVELCDLYLQSECNFIFLGGGGV